MTDSATILEVEAFLFKGDFDGIHVTMPVIGYLSFSPSLTVCSGEMVLIGGRAFELSNVTRHLRQPEGYTDISFGMKLKDLEYSRSSTGYIQLDDGYSSGKGQYVHPVYGTRLAMQWDAIQHLRGTPEEIEKAWREYKAGAKH